MMFINKITIFFLFILSTAFVNAQGIGTQNFIKNPHFSDSLNYYTTEYPITTNPAYPEGTYIITSNPYTFLNKYFSHIDHTQDEAKLMFFINSGRFDSDSGYILSQTVKNLNKNKRFKFSFWVAPNSNRNIASLRILLNDRIYEDSLTLRYNGDGIWNEYSYYLDSLHTDTFNFKIYSLSKERYGNDFAIDDFSLNALCDEQFNIIDTLRKCKVDAIKYKIDLINQNLNYNISWQTSNYLNIDNPSEPIFTNPNSQYFYLTIDDLEYGCSYQDSIFVENYTELPVNEISSNNNGVICPCSSTILSVPIGYNYLWNTNETTNEIIVSKAGKYWVEISTAENCKKLLEIEIKELTPIFDISIDTIYAKIGENITIPIKYNFRNINELSICKDLLLSIKLQYNPNLFLPDELSKYRIFKDNVAEILKIDLPISQSNNQFDIKGIALFGNLECTDLMISPADNCISNYNLSIKNGALCISDLCKEPSIRLISQVENNYSIEIIENNNQLRIKYNFPEANGNIIEIYNMLGKRIMNIKIENSKEGEKIIKNANLGSGVYFFKWENGINVIRGKFIK